MGKAASASWTGSSSGVRPYLVTRGRTAPIQDYGLQMDSLLMTQSAPGVLGPEDEALLGLCAGTCRSIAELAARMGQPIQVVKILAASLVGTGALKVIGHRPEPGGDIRTLEDLLVGLRNL